MNRVQLRERSRARSSADLRSVEVTAQGPLPLLTPLQAVLGNRAADQIRAGQAGSADELYLLDLARAAAETGHDLQQYLPWRATGAGRPLDAEERAFLEEVFGRPAPDARVHEGSASRQAALDIHARAFTIGDEIWFGEAPDLTTPAGAELLAHEITTQIVASLHLPAGSVNVPTDTAAAERAGAHGARGLAEGADIYLDPAQFDPSTGDGRALLAAIQPLEMGLPDGHVAAEGDVSAADLQALLAQYQTMNESRGVGFVTPPGSSSKPKADGTEDHQKKIDQYAEGVDGIADLTGDLDAFDDLCDAVDDKDESKAKTALNQIRSSEPYDQLSQTWQGAKEGKADEATLKAKFEAEFRNRSVWDSTDEAFHRVRDAAKKDAKPAAEAGKAKADLNGANGKGTPTEGTTTEKDQKDANNGQATREGTGVGAGNADLAALAAAKVDEKAPDLAAFNAMGQANDDLVAQAVYERNHQMGLSAEVVGGATEYGRTNQILSELGNGFAGSFEWLLYAPAALALLEHYADHEDRAELGSLLRAFAQDAPRLGGTDGQRAFEHVVAELAARWGRPAVDALLAA
jgi:hypothetical protein